MRAQANRYRVYATTDVVVHGPQLIGPTAMLVGARPLEPGFWFPAHMHVHPQILWSSRGVLAVAACDQRWVLPPARALWVPSGLVHHTGSAGELSCTPCT